MDAADQTVAALLDSIFDHAAALRDLGQKPPFIMPGFKARSRWLRRLDQAAHRPR